MYIEIENFRFNFVLSLGNKFEMITILFLEAKIIGTGIQKFPLNFKVPLFFENNVINLNIVQPYITSRNPLISYEHKFLNNVYSVSSLQYV